MSPSVCSTDHKTAGIIAEYNPFHNGHAYQIREIRRRSGADFVVAVMSGDFVQRGAPALLDKYARTRMALLGGADLVLELPCAAACGSAARFAGEAVRILDGLGVVQELWFGSETGKLEPLAALADVLAREPEPYRQALREFLRQGRSFPLARQKALEEYFAETSQETFPADLLTAPNNILGLEYCIALERLGSTLRPRTMKRAGRGYHDPSLEGPLCSASAIRQAVASGSPEGLDRQLPPEVYSFFTEALKTEGFLLEDDFSLLLMCRLLDSREEDLRRFMPEDTARRVLRLRNEFRSFSQFAELLKTRERTRSSMDRALLHFLLDIPQDGGADPGASFSGRLPCATLTDAGIVRVLGVRRRAVSLLSVVKEAGRLLPEARPGALPAEAAGADLRAANLYEAVRAQKTGQPFREERTRQPVIV